MRRWLFSLILILAIFLPSTVRAQAPLALDTLEIGIWPEFDKPSVLVIYRLTLPSSTAYPAALSIRIPASAGVPNAVAALQPDGSLLNIDYTPQVAGQWEVLSFSTNTPNVQVEYYDPSLAKNANARHFTYSWPGDYAISHLTIQVQQPAGATDMRIAPSLGAGATGSDGLTYYTQDIGAVSAGQTFQITIDYQKPNDVLSAETLPLESSAPIPQGSSTDINLRSWLPWVLGIVGAVLIIGGIFWFWQTGRQRPAPRTRRSRAQQGSYESEGNIGSTEEAIYCSQCGKRALPGDLFCRSCGSPIRAK